MPKTIAFLVACIACTLVVGCGSRSALRMRGADAGPAGPADDAAAVVPGDGAAAPDRPLAAAGLIGVGVTPALATAGVRTNLSFAATGTYADGTRRDLTATAAWSSSAPMVATVAGGTARTLAPGSSVIRATVMGVSGS